MRVSFDFDDTLTEKEVWEYALDLIDRGVDVWIVTARLEDKLVKEKYGKRLPSGKFWIPSYVGNKDLYRIADELGIPRENIKFTNLSGKGKWFNKHPNFEWHLEDSFKQIFDIENSSSVQVINVLKRDWKEKCEELLKRRDYHGYLS